MKLSNIESLLQNNLYPSILRYIRIIHGFTLNDEGLLVIFVMKVAADGFFNNLADDSDIIKSGPKNNKTVK